LDAARGVSGAASASVHGCPAARLPARRGQRPVLLTFSASILMITRT
jgi:hypothetical protein